jgi:hypothetical protein
MSWGSEPRASKGGVGRDDHQAGELGDESALFIDRDEDAPRSGQFAQSPGERAQRIEVGEVPAEENEPRRGYDPKSFSQTRDRPSVGNPITMRRAMPRWPSMRRMVSEAFSHEVKRGAPIRALGHAGRAGNMGALMRSLVSERSTRFTESVIREMTRLCHRHQGVNLAQGFPDFPRSKAIKEAAARAIHEDVNQYAITWGAKSLRDAIAAKTERFTGLRFDPETEMTVCCGSTECMVATLLALVNPGEEVVVSSLSTRTTARTPSSAGPLLASSASGSPTGVSTPKSLRPRWQPHEGDRHQYTQQPHR